MAKLVKYKDIYRGDTKTYNLTFRKDGIARDLTAHTILWMAKASLADTDANAIITKTITSHDDALGGLSHVDLTSADTLLPTAEQLCYIAVKLIKDDLSFQKTYALGQVLFTKGISDA